MNLKFLPLGVVLASFVLSGCSSITVLRTKEMKAVGDEIMVKCVEIDSKGRINLSRKAILQGK